MVAVSCGLTLQICLITALSFRCRRWSRALLLAKFHWHGALRSAHRCCTHGHVSRKKGGGKRELVSAPWTSSRRFSHVLWLKAHNHWLQRACFLSSKRKLPPPVCQARLGLLSVVCCLKGVLFPGTVYTCNQVCLSSAWAHCTSYAPNAYIPKTPFYRFLQLSPVLKIVRHNLCQV